MKKYLLLTILFLVISPITTVFGNVTGGEELTPLARAHAHNDYEHDRPLLDALDHGFTSVEADVWLVDGKLLVAHDFEDINPDRTLESLYLEPLRNHVKANGGTVQPGYEHDFILWIDIKSDGEATYRAIHEQLRKYQNILTRFLPSGVKPGSVSVYISGNRPRDYMENQVVRYAAYDGRMSDLGQGDSHEFIPVISDNWTKHFTWKGEGEMPLDEREKLDYIVSTAHANGQEIRFWATPDSDTPAREALWKVLLEAGVDLLNSDDLAGLQKFLLENDSNPSVPVTPW
ncbi:phosphatidylinositol-specific phospholipase C/glycerophosphodiester phosphodiesterase family protein [Bacillus sp. REN16]|uniref:phosphatidylinositol-specific phospholipase C/glycerophosphodiester phosphodiesterase family protein n=1 Tax=Bacillus sp. REN16 TaxID=2887296 RepID=UPI001E63570C|nr:phosphatidylinositol-specific phospholipase C/glycerophosphodiester phosphodiesterase family protein [Bacillus sp. REN16]MCC3356853.1 phosphatidylinositol-specific phospholipase C/glycerophosphodiester phosphodiesterase family protein [Bacillus sp. REN16]